jgi:hypothetical protein
VRVQADYWADVMASHLQVPRDRPLDEMTTELIGMIGDTDPRIRDETAYPILATWIDSGVYDDLLLGFGDGLSHGLVSGIGEDGTDSIFRRTFTALLLGECVSRDNAAQLLPGEAVVRWGDRAAAWFIRERDLRGYVDGKGWAHAVAHGADLLGELARSRHFDTLELTVLLDVVADRLLQPTQHRLVHGEDDRLAYAVMAALHRNLLGIDFIEPWVARIANALIRPRTATGGWPTPTAFNVLSFLRALHVQIAIGVKGRNTTTDRALFAAVPEVRTDVLLTLLDHLRKGSPWLF